MQSIGKELVEVPCTATATLGDVGRLAEPENRLIVYSDIAGHCEWRHPAHDNLPTGSPGSDMIRYQGGRRSLFLVPLVVRCRTSISMSGQPFEF